MSKLNFEEGLKYLSESDETLRKVISNLKPEKPDQREPNFESLIRIIAGQQLSSAAASTIFQRLKSRYTGQTITPEMIITTSSAEMLECGLSNPKVRYILQIAQGFQNQPNLIEDLKHEFRAGLADFAEIQRNWDLECEYLCTVLFASSRHLCLGRCEYQKSNQTLV